MTREIRLVPSSTILRIQERVDNRSATDRPIAWTQHATIGPPFLKRGVTEFRIPDVKAMSLEGEEVGPEQASTFTTAERSGGFVTHLIDASREHGFFLAFSPESGTFLRAHYGPNSQVGVDSLAGGLSNIGEYNANTILGWTHTFSPTLLLDTYASYLHVPVFRTPQNVNTDFSSIIPGLGPVSIEGAPSISIPNITNPSEAPSKDEIGDEQLNVALTKVLAKHTIKTGYGFIFDNHWNDGCNRGTYSFNGQYTGNGLADFLLGYPSSTAKVTPNCTISRYLSDQSGAYVQDDWKALPNLTINARIRYDLQWFLPRSLWKKCSFRAFPR